MDTIPSVGSPTEVIPTASLVELVVRYTTATTNPTSFANAIETTFDGDQLNVLRYVSISASAASLFAGIVSFYTMAAIHPSKLRFRHQLILFLIIFDFLKALALLIYPSLTLVHYAGHVGPKTRQFLGWFTAFSIEGGDIAILTFAVNTLVIVFFPKFKGGLYILRYYVYAFSVIGPAILASLAYINGAGYSAFDVWCYLPTSPRWYRLVLSWGPRYFLMLMILIIYSTIYFYVLNQVKIVDTHRSQINHASNSPLISSTQKVRYKGKVHIKHRNGFLSSLFSRSKDTTSTQSDPDLIQQSFQENLQFDNSQLLKNRHKVISKQIQFILLYPLAYFLLWIFPLIQESLILKFQSNYAIWCITAFMQPFNCAVDTIVYLVRETPWLFTYNKLAKSGEPIAKWRYYMTWLPLFELPVERLQDGVNDGPKSESKSHRDVVMSSSPKKLKKSSSNEDHDPFTDSNITTSTKRHVYYDTTLKSTNSEESGGEMDLLDFLQKGPPL